MVVAGAENRTGSVVFAYRHCGPFWYTDPRAKSSDGPNLECLVGRVDSDNLFCWFILVRSLPLGYLGWVAGSAPARAQSFAKQQSQPACA
jgi:hypothetical protein